MKERGGRERERDPLRFIPAAPVCAREMIKRCRSLRRGKNRLGEETFFAPFLGRQSGKDTSPNGPLVTQELG